MISLRIKAKLKRIFDSSNNTLRALAPWKWWTSVAQPEILEGGGV